MKQTRMILLLGLVAAFSAALIFAGTRFMPGSSALAATPKTSMLGYGAVNPKASYPTYQAPNCNTTVTQPYSADLQSAFSVASPVFLNQLTTLTCIFIYECKSSSACTSDEITSGSFGWRERPDQFAPGQTAPNRYIALSAALWNTMISGTLHPSNLDVYETALLASLLTWPSGSTAPTITAPSGSTANGVPMTLLDALAHEYGHVLFYDAFRPTPGGPFDFSSFCRGKFFAETWKTVDPPPRWRNFGDVQGEHNDDYVQISDILIALNRSNSTNDPGDLLHQIYDVGAPWASLFAAFSPDEDFVETFKLNVLESATTPLTTLPITIVGTSNYTDNILANHVKKRKPVLGKKARCFSE
jgi:hypothetical protein